MKCYMCAAAAAALLVFANPVWGAPITYVETMMNGSGVLDGKPFTNALVIATFTGDTSNIITTLGFGATFAIPVSGKVYVAGVGSDTLTDSPMVLALFPSLPQFNINSPIAIFFDEGPGGIGIGQPGACVGNACYAIGVFVTENAALGTYGLATSFGPVSGPGGGSTVSQIAPACLPSTSGPQCAYYPTTSGTFYWTVSPTASTFTATTSLTVIGSSLPDSVVGGAYSQTIMSAGGIPPYSFSILSGRLPPGLTLNAATGLVSGTPTNPSSSLLRIQVTDSSTPPQTATSLLLLNATSGQLAIAATSLPSGQVGVPYLQSLQTLDGLPPLIWGTADPLPNGLTLNTATGFISGTPTTAVKNSRFLVSVTDATGKTATAAFTLTID